MVKDLRKQRGLNQVELAAIAHLSPSLISQIESGKEYINLRFITVIALDKALKANGKLFSYYRNSLLPGVKAKTHATLKAAASMEETKTDLPESSCEDYALDRLQRTMPGASPIFKAIQSESIVPNLLKIQKFHELSDAEFAELIGVSKRVWSLAERSGTALNSATVERIVERFPEAIPISFHENAKRSFGRLLKKLRRQKRLTLQQLAGNSGISGALISTVERGGSVDLNLRHIKKLDKSLNANGELEQYAFRLLPKGKRSRQTQ